MEDIVPFFVRPPRGVATADVAILFPTVSYGAYANERMQDRPFVHEPGVLGREILPDDGDLALRQHPEFGASLYDSHADGSGVCFSSFRRPVLNMRPGHRNWQTHAPRALSADLYLVDWLRAEGMPFDTLCDHDLHAEGDELLAPYRVLISGCHPEYWTATMLDALEAWLDGGGRLMYLGGNGFYWVTSIDPARPHVVEVRRGVCGIRTWESAPGEHHHTSTGELGGLWRNRGRSPNALVGIGFAAQGFDGQAPGYHQLPDAADPRAAFAMEGIDPGEKIGAFGLSMGGAASDEIDRHDIRYGSPPEALVIATSQGGHSDYVLLVCEDMPVTHLRLGGTTCEEVRADIVLMPTARGGAVFSTGSIGWTAAMAVAGYDNNVARMTGNVLRRFLDPEPLDLVPTPKEHAA
jgi:N,N-dimethylformamidase